MKFNPVTAETIAALVGIVGAENVSTAVAERQLRSQDMSRYPAHLSEVVIWPTTAPQVADILRLANALRVPVTPWGAGSALEGHAIPIYGGISLAMERLAEIVAIHADDFQVTVQPGIGYKDLNQKLAPYGLFFPPDPGANASIGGMLANNAAGIRTVKYGATKDNVLRVQVALADGRLLNLGCRSIKQASGYDLLHLFVGSEGTLGVFTEATLRLTPIPNLMSAVMASFGSVETAVAAVVAIRGSGLDVAGLEFLDADTIAMLAAENGLDLPAQPTLLLELHAAHEASLHLGLEMVSQICREMGSTRLYATADPLERRRLWHARHHAFETTLRRHPGYQWITTDVAVPITAYPQLIAAAQQALAQQQVLGYLFGHAGDGNIHVNLGFRDEAEMGQATAVNHTLILTAIALGGTATGEHGVGLGKIPFLRREHGPALDVMRTLKQTLDPNGILNPGKIFAE